MCTEVGALREVLAQEPVCVLVRAALPVTPWIAEIDLQSRVDRQLHVLGHLGALVQVRDFFNCVGNDFIARVIASRTASAQCPARAGPRLSRGCCRWPGIGGRCSSIVNRVVLSTNVPIAELSNPKVRSPFQWPGTARSSTLAGRSLIITWCQKRLPATSNTFPWHPQSTASAQTRGQFLA